MKSYSKFNILGTKLSGNMYKGVSDFFSSQKKTIELTLSYYDYIRGDVFIDDTREAYGDIPLWFSVTAMIHLLYTDFMNEIKKGIPHNDVAAYLKQGKERHLNNKIKEKRVMKTINKNLFSFEVEIEEEEDDDERVIDIEIKMKQAEILRGEILLHDLSPLLGEINITFEILLKIIYLNFIDEVKAKGNTPLMQKAIINKLNS